MTREEALEKIKKTMECHDRKVCGLAETCEECPMYVDKDTEYEAHKVLISALSQEPKADKPMCDRNICLNNEYNGIGCDECIVNKAEQEPMREFTEEEAKAYSKALDKMYKPTGFNVFNETCDDAISREWLMRKATERFYTTNYFNHILAMIEEAPSVTQKSGKWILLDECANSGYYCSNCQKKLVKEGWSQTVKKIKYCPNCGSAMKGE